MSPTHDRDNSHQSHDVNNSNTPKNVRNSSSRFLKRIGSYKRVSTMLAAFVVVGVLAAGFMVVSGRAVGMGVHLPASLTKIFSSRTARPAPAPRTISAPAVEPLAPLAVTTSWDFSPQTGGSNNFGTSPLAPSSSDPNVTIGSLTRGTGIGTTGTGAANAWGGNDFTIAGPSQATAITNNEFATFTITANGGFTVSLSDIAAYNIRRSGTGPATGIWQYQIGAGAFNDIGSAITWGGTTTSAGNAQSAITLSGISALQNVPAGTTITLRVVTWGATSTGGTWYLNDPADTIANDFIVNGTTAAAPPDATFNASGNLAAGTYNNVTINNCGTFVTMTGNVVINGTLTINACAHLLTESSIVSGTGSFVQAADGWLHIGDANGITTSPTLSGSIQVTGGRSYSTAGNYQYTGNTNQAVGNGLPSTVNNLTISNNAGVTLSASVAASGVLALTSGDITTTSSFVLTQSGTSSGTGDVVGTVRRTDVNATAKSFGNPNVQIGNASTITVDVTLTKAIPGGFASAVARNYFISGAGVSGATVRLHYLESELNGNTPESALTLWRADGDPGTWTDQGAESFDATANWVQQTNISQFSPWAIAAAPAAPTAVKLRSFAAKRTDSGVLLEWDSGFEVDNLGYNIYREQNGRRTLVTPSLIAGSALKTGPGMQLTAGMSYAWWDMNASEHAQYWLEDIDLDGKATIYGPFTQQQAAPGTARPPASRLLSQLRTGKNGLLQSAEQKEWPATFDNLERGKDMRSSGISEAQVTPLEQQFQLAGQSAVKLSVNQDGWYRVTRDQLIAGGLNANADPSRLQLYRNGEELPMRVGPDSTIEFYGRNLDTLTTDTAVYWLIEGAVPGQRVGTMPVLEANDQIASGFAMTVERRDRVIYYSSLQNGDTSNIFGPIITSEAATQSLYLRNMDTSANGQAQLEVALQGVSAANHIVQVTLNGQQVGVINFTGRDHPIFSVPVANGLLLEGENIVTLTRMNGQSDTSLVDYARITYARTFEAVNDKLACTVPAGYTVRLGGFSSKEVRVIDITNPSQPRELKVTAEPEPNGFAVTMVSEQDARLVAFTEDSPKLTPFAIAHNEPSRFNSMGRGVDMVIITHRDFRQAVEPLAAHRRTQGLAVAVIDVEDVYDEFAYGTHSPQAIKDFLALTRQNRGRVPRYVLLVGDSSWDARNELGLTPSEFVPTKLIDTNYMETASDDWMADFDNNGVAEMAIGRLPVKTAAQAATLVSKIITYDSTPVDPTRGAMLVADGGFEATSDGLRGLLPQGMPVQTINRSSASDSVIRQQILTGINGGPRIVNYMGHGSVQVWTGAGLLQASDADTLTNGNRLPLFVAMTCLNGYAHDAYIDSLSEALLKTANGGAIAVWSSSGYTEPGGQVPINRQLYQELFNQPGIRLGDAINLAKGSTVNSDVRRTWVLLGDPSMKLR